MAKRNEEEFKTSVVLIFVTVGRSARSKLMVDSMPPSLIRGDVKLYMRSVGFGSDRTIIFTVEKNNTFFSKFFYTGIKLYNVYTNITTSY